MGEHLNSEIRELRNQHRESVLDVQRTESELYTAVNKLAEAEQNSNDVDEFNRNNPSDNWTQTGSEAYAAKKAADFDALEANIRHFDAHRSYAHSVLRAARHFQENEAEYQKQALADAKAQGIHIHIHLDQKPEK